MYRNASIVVLCFVLNPRLFPDISRTLLGTLCLRTAYAHGLVYVHVLVLFRLHRSGFPALSVMLVMLCHVKSIFYFKYYISHIFFKNGKSVFICMNTVH